MRLLLLFISLMTLVSCGTVPRPDLPVVKQAGKVYEQYQSTLCGVPLGKPKRRAVPSKMDKTQAVLRVPAKWLLWLALPAAALAGAVCLVATIYLQNVKLAKLCAVGAGALFLAALFATAWLIATTWMWVFAPLLALLLISTVVVAYKLTKGTRPTLLQQSYG